MSDVPPDENASNEIWVPVSAIAAMFGMTERRIHQLVNDSVLPRKMHGKYALVACVRAYVAHLKTLSEGQSAASERAKLLKAQRERVEIEVAAMRRDLIPADEVRQNVGRCLTNARSTLLGIQKGIEQRYGREVGEYVQEEHDRALTEIARAAS